MNTDVSGVCKKECIGQSLAIKKLVTPRLLTTPSPLLLFTTGQQHPALMAMRLPGFAIITPYESDLELSIANTRPNSLVWASINLSGNVVIGNPSRFRSIHTHV